MKKVIVLMMAVMIATFGFSFTANADCGTCCPSMNIDRGCEGEQECCYPFDFEDNYYGKATYCEYPSGKEEGCDQKAWFEICQCLEAEGGTWPDLVQDDTVDVSMEILVNGQPGDNGVYWAQDVNGAGIPMDTYVDVNTACERDKLGKRFGGLWTYYEADGAEGTPDEGYCAPHCDVPAGNRVVKLGPTPGQPDPHGYMITALDVATNLDTWIVDIPYLRVDPNKVTAGDVVQVKVCFIRNLAGGGICGDCDECCCIITIGPLCCESVDSECCIYHPYVVANDPYGFWTTGIALTLMDSVAPADAVVTLTLTDQDGNVVTCVKDDFTGPIWAGSLDDLTFSGPFTGGPCLLEIVANSPIDSYCYLTGNGFFGAGTLARECWWPWSTCSGVNCSD